jgi:site-specific recombinase XerD
MLRLAQKRWPPEPVAVGLGDVLCLAVYNEYQEWLRVHRGLADKSIYALMWEGRHFLTWYINSTGALGFTELCVRDIDAYFELRSRRLRRRSLKDVAERLRSILRHLHRTGRTPVDLAPRVVGPTLYAYENIPAALSAQHISTVLKVTRKDHSSMGLRDYAILQLLSTYGLRSGEITRLRIEDIDWRAEILHVCHWKTSAHSQLPLMRPVGEALLNYLRRGRPQTDVREVFIRARAPYRRLSGLNPEICRRLEAAGVRPEGKCGPHIFRHARAVSLLRASVPRKIIGDLLGHRSEEATIPYLKLATEDLRAIALEIPEVQS